MGDFSVKAVLSAVDQNFTTTMKSAMGYTNNLKSTLTSGLGFGVLVGIGQQAFSSIANGMVGLSKETIGTSDSMQKLQQAMKFSGSSEAEIQRIAGSTGTLKTYADKTVFSLNDVMSTFGALSANGIKDADKMTEAVGNAVAVFGGGANEFSGVALAFSQSMASGKMNAQDWNQIINASPQLAGGLRKELVRLNPVLGDDFKGAMEGGAITADLLGQAMNNIGMTDMAKEAAQSVTTFEGAMGNLEATATSGIMKLYDSFAKTKIVDAVNGMNVKVGASFDWLANTIPTVIEDISPYWTVFKEDVVAIKDAFGSAIGAIVGEFSKLTGAFGSDKSIDSFSDMLGIATGALTTFAGFLEEHADIIAKAITVLPKLFVAYKGFRILSTVIPLVGSFTGAIGGIAKLGLSKIAPKLFGVARGQDAVGKSSGGSSKTMLASAKAFMMLGVGVLMISAGFYLLAQSAVAVANAGPLAVGVLAGLVVTVSALSIGMLKMISTMSGSVKKITAVSMAFLALGTGVLLICAGFALLAYAAIQLASAGPLAIGVMIGLVAAVALLAIGAAILGPALTAGAVGFIAFGIAIVLVGVGALLAASALILVAGILPDIIQYGESGAFAISQLGLGMIAFAGGAALAGLGCATLGIGLAVVAIGLALVGVAVIIVAIGVLALAAGVSVLSVGMTITGAALMVVAMALPMVAVGALASTAALAIMLTMSLALTASLALLTIPLLLVSATFLVATLGIIAFSLAVTVGSVGVFIMATALLAVDSSMKSISKNAKSAKSSIANMVSSIDVVNSGLDALQSKAKGAVDKLISAFSSGKGKVQSEATALAKGFTNGLQTGFGQIQPITLLAMAGLNAGLQSGGSNAISIANMTSRGIVTSLMSASSGSYSCGLNIGQGLANGMRASLGVVQGVATQLAAAAEEAIRAKAQIHSPSRIADKLGQYWGGGYVNGILSKIRGARKASEELVHIPSIASSPEIPGGVHSRSGNRELNSDYQYGNNATYTIIVPLDVDGREFAKATATYNQEELDKLEKRNNRKRGHR